MRTLIDRLRMFLDAQSGALKDGASSINEIVSASKEDVARISLRLEMIRIAMYVTMLASALVAFFLLTFAFPGFLPESPAMSHKRVAGYVVLLIGVMLAYEIVSLIYVSRNAKSELNVSDSWRYVNGIVENSFPTLALYLATFIHHPAVALYQPPFLLYFFAIVPTLLQLRFTVSLWAGFVACVSYFALAAHVLSTALTDAPIGGVLTDLPMHLTRAIMLLSCGLMTGVVAVLLKMQQLGAIEAATRHNEVLATFGRHVSPAVAKRLIASRGIFPPREQDVCIMFFDIRGFSTWSEGRPPEEVLDYLNNLFGELVGVVNRNGGIVNKFLGDGFMAVFGAPFPDLDARGNALRASLEMIRTVEIMVSTGVISPTRIGIGLHAGTAMTGNVGSNERQEYTVIGDVVNLASRIESKTKELSAYLLLSDGVFNSQESSLCEQLEDVGKVELRGIETTYRLYRLAWPCKVIPIS